MSRLVPVPLCSFVSSSLGFGKYFFKKLPEDSILGANRELAITSFPFGAKERIKMQMTQFIKTPMIKPNISPNILSIHPNEANTIILRIIKPIIVITIATMKKMKIKLRMFERVGLLNGRCVANCLKVLDAIQIPAMRAMIPNTDFTKPLTSP